MSTVQIWQTVSTGADDTSEIAESIGRKIRGGEFIELVSDLGGGKTTFVRGLAKGMGSKANVRSPSFTLGNQYRAGNLTLYHFDFYRLQEPGVVRDELAEATAEPAAIVAVEWAGIVDDILPKQRLTVRIKATGEDSRELTFEFPRELEYLTLGNT